MKKIVYIVILVILSFTIFNGRVDAAKVSGDSVTFTDQKIDGISEHRPKNSTGTVSEVCLYERVDKESKTTDSKELLIYTDGTASIFWYGNWCQRQAIKSNISGNYCVDGEALVLRGIRNWKRNPNGVDKNLDSELDASSWYSKNKKCPEYLAQAEKYGSNLFYVSVGDKKQDYDKIKRKASNLGGTTYMYYNTGESTPDFTADVSCKYSIEKSDDDSDENEKLEIGFSKSGSAKVSKFSKFKKDKYDIYGVNLSSRITNNRYISKLKDNKCPKTLESCVEPFNSNWFTNIAIFAGKLSALSSWKANMLDQAATVKIFGDSSMAGTFCPSELQMSFYCIGDNCSDETICMAYDDLEAPVLDAIEAYSKVSKSNTSESQEKLNDYIDKKNQLNEYCVSVLKTQNYAEGTCMDSCLKLTKKLAKLETDYGLKNPYADSKCNIGESIVNMVYNVLKWAKYIAPVLVIILSMLDFIKAIASQSDDEMKKAQGKFVKRLIVAALLFLLPFIINFVLKTFGFYNSKCDITDLF